ncbi:hypothetical protein KQ302_13355 [Synechococcus sp. CS-602]|uniref:hypothetical protein n=1 Tax=Synechococcaceae TaxID=1890426 RepID=UPI0008FF4E3E|nr:MULTISPECIES: hypothetical protein [Synechococcaceae]MCT4365320.1 hypothetical protein [Candidatus Regnicoccus frigidus MAG-AL1]APD48272.1 hypothetical protein BM449_08485 [Synechococcus sp. SynAce01]MCT0201568.1 hypothetical protein [Synechococcus sp. CS-603]MCT0206075.1 hypothetical protein [Synechococcus sp. CS-602]MCT0244999.1 hypothetical protein [Synechococcus sp. CS-601]
MAFFSGVLITGIFLVAWLLGRPGLGQRASARGGTSPGRALPAASLVAKTKTKTKTKIQDKATGWAAVTDLEFGSFSAGERQKQRLLRELAVAFRGRGDDRLAAIHLALRSGDRSVLPFLRRGRLDSDPRVAALAAEGLVRFRGKPAAQPLPLPLRRPRKVSRTR